MECAIRTNAVAERVRVKNVLFGKVTNKGMGQTESSGSDAWTEQTDLTLMTTHVQLPEKNNSVPQLQTEHFEEQKKFRRAN